MKNSKRFQINLPGELLQANIFKPDGRKYRNYVFIRFKQIDGGKTQLRQTIKKIAQKYLTSQSQQELDTINYKKSIRDGGNYKSASIINIGFTYPGMEQLLNSAALRNLTIDRSFRNGMRQSQARLQDYGDSWQDHKTERGSNVDCDWFYSESGTNEAGESGQPSGCPGDEKIDLHLRRVDMFISIASSDDEICVKKTTEIRDALSKSPGIGFLFTQAGVRLRNAATNKAESPLSFQEGFSDISDKDSLARRLLVKERWHLYSSGAPTYGTYLAFRKLEIHQDEWKKRVESLVGQLKPTVTTKKDESLESYAKALLMGRFENGTPLAISKEPLGHEYWTSEGKDLPFNYRDDPAGARCPLGAHVRAMNPQGSEKNDLEIVRRGISYQEENTAGLLFVSLQKSIDDQFEPLFDRMAAPFHVDAIAYRSNPNDPNLKIPAISPEPQLQIPTGTGKEISLKPFILPGGENLTTFRGGDYFYLPSVAFLCTFSVY
ncbi:Dyp-type peroxidase [Neolewinella antarctica]|uniref:Deferrochelatase/peroxidase EfeB n=1 Tax=Neolewinella antarctica TaxID=442734 RepID=A0ABX0XFI0_9BACT|nr:Dyp-type peroxidase domain-containing protein [Neolewinella antarctica]NJC27628.1 deferrochelatase/peroxidase EfeB [Neolewinella antarctica]